MTRLRISLDGTPGRIVDRCAIFSNRGVYLLRQVEFKPLSVPAGIYIGQALNSADPFYQAQKGGNGFCGPAEMNQLFQTILTHERLHYTRFRAATQRFDVQSRLEEATVLPSVASSAEAITAVFEAVRRQFHEVVVASDTEVEKEYPPQRGAPDCNMRNP